MVSIAQLPSLLSSLGVLLIIFVIIAITIVIARIVETFLERYFKQAAVRFGISETKYVVLRRLIILTVYVIGILVLIALVPQLQSIWLGIFASVSIISIIVGIAAQSTLSNVIAGISIVFSKPFRVGDYITLRGEHGFVKDITFRHTVVQLWDRVMVIPNSVVNNEVVFNHSNGTIIWHLELRVNYDTDLALARALLLNEVYQAEVVEQNSASVDVAKTDELGITLRLNYKVSTKPFESEAVLREAIVMRFINQGIKLC